MDLTGKEGGILMMLKWILFCLRLKVFLFLSLLSLVSLNVFLSSSSLCAFDTHFLFILDVGWSPAKHCMLISLMSFCYYFIISCSVCVLHSFSSCLACRMCLLLCLSFCNTKSKSMQVTKDTSSCFFIHKEVVRQQNKRNSR